MNKKLLTIFLTVFMDLVGFGLIIPLSPFLARQFHADPFQIGILMAIYSGMQFLFSPIWGQVSDRIGRKPVIILCLFGTAIGHAFFAFAVNLWGLFLARAVAGLFSGNISTAMAYVADVTSEKDRSKGMGLMGAAFGLGFIFGPALGAGFASMGARFGDAAPFGPQFSALAAAVICALNGALAIVILSESLPLANRKAKAKSHRLLALRKVLRLPIVGSLISVAALSTLGMALIENQLFLFVSDKFNWGLSQASLGFAYVGMIMVFTQGYLIRKFLPVWGERRVLTAGLILCGCGFLLMATAQFVAWLAVGVTFLGLGVGLVNPSVNGSISLLSAKTEQGEVMGVTQGLSALSRVIGPLIGGWCYKELGMHSPFFLSAALVAFAIVLALRVYADLPMKSLEVNA